MHCFGCCSINLCLFLMRFSAACTSLAALAFTAIRMNKVHIMTFPAACTSHSLLVTAIYCCLRVRFLVMPATRNSLQAFETRFACLLAVLHPSCGHSPSVTPCSNTCCTVCGDALSLKQILCNTGVNRSNKYLFNTTTSDHLHCDAPFAKSTAVSVRNGGNT